MGVLLGDVVLVAQALGFAQAAAAGGCKSQGAGEGEGRRAAVRLVVVVMAVGGAARSIMGKKRREVGDWPLV